MQQATFQGGKLPAKQWPRPRPVMEPLHPNTSYRPIPPNRNPPRIGKSRTEHDILAERSGFYPVYRYRTDGKWQYYSDGAGGRLHFQEETQAASYLEKREGRG